MGNLNFVKDLVPWRIKCEHDGRKLCYCVPQKFRIFQTGGDCLHGERRMTANDPDRKISFKRERDSNTLLDALPEQNHTIEGSRTYRETHGWKATGETCEFDCNFYCKNPPRSRHEENCDIYGRSSG